MRQRDLPCEPFMYTLRYTLFERSSSTRIYHIMQITRTALPYEISLWNFVNRHCQRKYVKYAVNPSARPSTTSELSILTQPNLSMIHPTLQYPIYLWSVWQKNKFVYLRPKLNKTRTHFSCQVLLCVLRPHEMRFVPLHSPSNYPTLCLQYTLSKSILDYEGALILNDEEMVPVNIWVNKIHCEILEMRSAAVKRLDAAYLNIMCRHLPARLCKWADFLSPPAEMIIPMYHIFNFSKNGNASDGGGIAATVNFLVPSEMLLYILTTTSEQIYSSVMNKKGTWYLHSRCLLLSLHILFALCKGVE